MSNLFGTDGIRGVAGQHPITIDFSSKLANVLSNLACCNKKKVAIGKDTRISGDMLESALTAEFTANGIDVVSLGVVPTPLLTSKTQSLDVDMAIMITASHNPYFDNGLKLISSTGDKFSDDLYEKIEKEMLLDKKESNTKEFGKVIRKNEIVEEYIDDMRKIAPNYKALQGIRVVLDCANGAYSYILPQTFKDLGAGVIAINNTPNGYNINENCGSQHTDHLSETVREAKAHFGIAVDGDGDRVILVDEKGNLIDGDQLLCLLAKYLKKQNKLTNDTVISTEWSNLGLGEYLENNGYNYYKSKVGERYVIDLMKEKGATLGGEVVGHIVLSDYAVSGDALATAIIIALAYIDEGKKMSEIFPIFKPYPCIIRNIRFNNREEMLNSVEQDDVKAEIEKSKAMLGSKSTLIVRKSGTEPAIKLRIEDLNENVVLDIADNLEKAISKYKK